MAVRNRFAGRDEFYECVTSIFNNWSALQLAVDHGMGGSPQESNEKVNDMANIVAALCLSGDISDEKDIAYELEDLLDHYFDTIVEDGSANEVGHLLWNLSRQWLSGDRDRVKSYISSLKKEVKNHVECKETSEKTEEMDVVEEKKECDNSSTIEASNQLAQDDWVVVKKTRNQRH